MPTHVIIGASASGVATAKLLADRGQEVRIVSRRGTGPDHPAIELISADAANPEALTAVAKGAVALYNTANPPYDRWLTDWPPLASSLLITAERTGAVLASAATLYGYGPTNGPMTEASPLAGTHPKLQLRAGMWNDALAAHEAGRIRATEVRSSDILQGTGVIGATMVKPLLAGRRAFVPMPLDQPHTFTSANDVAAALVAVASDERAWGRAWHTPSNEPLTIRQLADRFARATGSPSPQLTSIPFALLWTAGVFAPLVRELRVTRYQWDRPFVVDSSNFTQAFGLEAEPIDGALRETAELARW